jgi:hypothetical protein
MALVSTSCCHLDLPEETLVWAVSLFQKMQILSTVSKDFGVSTTLAAGSHVANMLRCCLHRVRWQTDISVEISSIRSAGSYHRETMI